MNVVLACMSDVCALHVCVLRKSKEGEGSLGVGGMVSCEPSCGCWWIEPDSLPKTKQQNKTKLNALNYWVTSLAQILSEDKIVFNICACGADTLRCVHGKVIGQLWESVFSFHGDLERTGVVRTSQHRLHLLSYLAGPILKSDRVSVSSFLTEHDTTCGEPKRTRWWCNNPDPVTAAFLPCFTWQED